MARIWSLATSEGGGLTASAIARWRRLVAAGGVLAIPTESSYGLAAAPDDRAGVERIFALKGRPADQPLPVVVASVAQLPGLGVNPLDPVVARLEALWPAPLTAVLPIAEPLVASAGRRSLAVRVPAHDGLRQLLAGTGPLTATSANRSGQAPFLDAQSVAEWMSQFERRTGSPRAGLPRAGLPRDEDAVIDGGRLPGGPPSTLVDFSGSAPRVLRAGAFQGADLERLIETATLPLTYRD